MKTLIKNVNLIHPEEKINLQGINILINDGVIEKIHYKEGELVDGQMELVEIKE